MRATQSASRVSFFRVPLVCEAASHIGCGTRARPVLVEMEQEPGVREAWLNRDGTVLGIVWADESAYPERVMSILRRHGTAGLELKGSEHAQARDSFAAAEWYRPAALHDLSAEEARVIAARLMGRLEKETSVSVGTAERLAKRIEDACAGALANASAASPSMRREQIASALLNGAKDVLDPAAFRAFSAVVDLGHRPLPGES